MKLNYRNLGSSNQVQEKKKTLPELAQETKKVLSELTQETKKTLPEQTQETRNMLPELGREGQDRSRQDRLGHDRSGLVCKRYLG